MSDFLVTGVVLESYTGSDAHVTVPDGVEIIGEDAFKDCDFIVSVDLPKGLYKIEGDAFTNCEGLKEINLPESLEDIDMNAFENCKSLKAIDIPKNVNFVSGCSFCGCDSLEKITVDKENQFYTAIDNVLFNKDKTELIKYAPAKKEKSYCVPQGVFEIVYDAFRDSSSLEQVTVPEGVEIIYPSVFENCKDLRNVTLPESLYFLGYSAFEGCTSLTSMIIPKDVKELHFHTFSGCESLEYVEIQNESIEISEIAFSDCDSLKYVKLPSTFNETTSWWKKRFSPQVIAVSALDYLDKDTKIVKYLQKDKLATIDLLAKAKRLDLVSKLLEKSPKIELASLNDIINHVSRLGSIEANSVLLDYKNKHFTKEEEQRLEAMELDKSLGLRKMSIADYKRLFRYQEKNGKIIINGLKSNVPHVEIPEAIGGKTVTEIGDYAFSKCTNLVSLIIPKTVTEIGTLAFYGADNLTIYPQLEAEPASWSPSWHCGCKVEWKSKKP